MNAFYSLCSDAGGFLFLLRKVYVDFCSIIWNCDTFFLSLHRVRIVSNAEERLMNVNTDAQANGEDTDYSSSSLFLFIITAKWRTFY